MENSHSDLYLQDNSTPEFSLDGQEIWAKVVDIYDADTCKIVIFLNNKFIKFNCRLTGIDTPEMKPSKSKPNRDLEKKAAKRARNRLVQLVTNCDIDIDKHYRKSDIRKLLLTNNLVIRASCDEFDKYGRLLVTLFNDNQSANQSLIDEGFAYAYDGGTKTKWVF
jgi:endonuclease YncB( thermonuclease family)